ncbi:LacI family DNA-binding transcriptional regulator [Ruania alba]|nr:substrate-binding domain-containing protein [Ruania alba]
MNPTALKMDDLPVVRLSPEATVASPSEPIVDTVYMDDVDGGRRAARWLAQQGHRRIAFLGLHTSRELGLAYRWSALREQGWRQAMSELGEPVAGLVFLPRKLPETFSREMETAAAAAKSILGRADITAVVCANDDTAMGLRNVLEESGVPPANRPSLIGFDDAASADGGTLTSMRLPWEDIGRKAAELLFGRASGRLIGPPQHHELPMTLVSRIMIG